MPNHLVSTFWEPTMKKLSSLGAIAFAALVAGLAILGFSTPAQAYPDLHIDLSARPTTLYGGQQFTATAESEGTTCSWTLDWNGTVRVGSSYAKNPFTTTYTAPEVSKVTKIPLDGTCVYTAPSARGASTWHQTIVITVLPRNVAVSAPGGSHLPNTGGSDLPNTGGPNMLFLAGGLVLLLSGATAVTVARRRAEEAEIRAFRA
ncbi:MAG: LPXTG cell wall anchor domain-containing protein [Angustibacter sp.]